MEHTIFDKIFWTKSRNLEKLDRSRKVFRLLLPSFNFWKGGCLLSYVSTKVWDFLNISFFPKILSLTLFDNLWGSSYYKFPILHITFCFICGESDLCQNTVKLQNIITKIFWKFSFCSLHFQWWFRFLEKMLIWLKKVSTVKKLPICNCESSLYLIFDLHWIFKILLTQIH